MMVMVRDGQSASARALPTSERPARPPSTVRRVSLIMARPLDLFLIVARIERWRNPESALSGRCASRQAVGLVKHAWGFCEEVLFGGAEKCSVCLSAIKGTTVQFGAKRPFASVGYLRDLFAARLFDKFQDKRTNCVYSARISDDCGEQPRNLTYLQALENRKYAQFRKLIHR